MSVWTKVGEKLKEAFPLVGSLLGGPAGGMVGAMIAKALSVKNDPKAVLEAIEKDKDAYLKLKQFEAENELALKKLAFQAEEARLAEETKRIQAVNTTMQIEAQSGDSWQRKWRPFWGFSTAIAFNSLLISLSISVLYGCFFKQAQIVSEICKSVIPLLTNPILWTLPAAVLGITAWTRGREKIEKIRIGNIKKDAGS